MYRDQNEVVADFAKSLPPQFDSLPRELMISELKRHGLTDESAMILHLNLLEQDSLSFDEVQELIKPAPMELTEGDKVALGDALGAMLPSKKAPVGMFRAILRGLDLAHAHPFMQEIYSVPDNAEFTREEVYAMATKHGLELDPLAIPPYADEAQPAPETVQEASIASEVDPAATAQAGGPSAGFAPGSSRGEAGSMGNNSTFNMPKGAAGYSGAAPAPKQDKVEEKVRQQMPYSRPPMGMGMQGPVIDPFQGILNAGVAATNKVKSLVNNAKHSVANTLTRRDQFRQAREAYKSPSMQEIFNNRADSVAKQIDALRGNLRTEEGPKAADQLMERLSEVGIVSESNLSEEAKGNLEQSLKGLEKEMNDLSPEQREAMDKQLSKLSKAIMKALSKLFGGKGKDLDDELENDGPSM